MPALRPLPAEPDDTLHAGAGRQRRVRHLLVLGGADDGGEIARDDLLDLAELAASRFPSATLTTEPGPVGDVAPGIVTLSRHTTLVGPYGPGAGLRAPSTAHVVDVLVPRERGERALAGSGDPDGLSRVFDAGLPVREEARVVAWLVDVARRLHGTLVLATDAGPATLTPDPDAHVDLTVHSDVWLDPEAALATLRTLDARVVYAPDGSDWGGPPDELRLRGPAISVLDDAARAALHDEADTFDIRTLTTPEQRTGYALHLDLGDDGLVAVEIGGEESPPTSVTRNGWAADGVVAYRVRWFPIDDLELLEENPDPGHRIARTRAAERMGQLARALHDAVGGVVTDAADLPVHPEDL
ncbi:hypothetical protein [Sanguibacter sp. HDW7]|uniref:hypothetical protein n=1 Tax=Sanguibacter sp. HDW7 TaxID=2714931 RepID=UPI0014093195|nr:hypothetical protein [Sanguibacter sp. HDW7]QIK84579.1 hypothetical protein G7063_13880 [Sanguibacter sp. HDW7]